ncbi:(4Fe-4S)-binding protein, partial [uncultured Thiocystis sp.]|uniref:(4Fe-4S)-binding protein n=1 Tax=uncultured Thiocystis sp. TaxID=1202134 RepID=UPI0025EB5BC8
MSDKQAIDYPGGEIDVRWDARLCLHIGECGLAKGDLFVGGREPWCLPNAASRAEVREVVERCPSGALSYTDKSGVPEAAPAGNTVTVVYNGPLYLTGDLRIEGAGEDMPGVRTRAALCRCGASRNKPFCD